MVSRRTICVGAAALLLLTACSDTGGGGLAGVEVGAVVSNDASLSLDGASSAPDGAAAADGMTSDATAGVADAWVQPETTTQPEPDATEPPDLELQPCEDNDDCFSGYCVPTPEGNVCTKTCDEDCPDGWACKPVATGGDVTYICVYLALTHCDPCQTDEDCEHPLVVGQGSRCLGDDPAEGTFCRFACGDLPCPPGSSCQDTEIDGAMTPLCFPDDGGCACSQSAIDASATTGCEVSNAVGTCAGTRVCEPEGLSACDAPEAEGEVCDGLDNDCDGLLDGADDDLAAVPCAVQAGACEGAMTSACVEGVWSDCDAVDYAAASADYEPEELRCDGLDNDCDGLTDEGFSLTLPDGAVAEGVGQPCGLGVCDGDVTACNDTQDGLVCVTGELDAEVCNGLDDDCDGLVDADDPDLVTPPCDLQSGVCQGALHPPSHCEGGAWSPCTEADYLAHAEDFEWETEASCDGADNDCDDATDEGFSWTEPSGEVLTGTGLPCGTGACADGETVCTALGTGMFCSTSEAATLDDTCDGVDQDCDGQSDEHYVATDTACGQGLCATSGSLVCVDGAPVDTCEASAGAETDGLCDGLDEDCDGEIDEDYVPTETSCGDGVCAAQGQLLCEGGQTVDTCAPLEATGDDTLCDGLDDDCDGSTDEHYVASETACGQGACAASGVLLCEAGVEVDTCEAGEPTAADDDCDGGDDDCDGEIDEAYVPVTTGCGTGACAAEGLSLCEAGVLVDTCEAGEPTGSDDTCDGVDDTCDGQTDEGYIPTVTNCGVGVCEAQGVLLCEAGDLVDTCEAGLPSAADTTCDEADDDCDGLLDEDYPETETVCGVGICGGTGTLSCAEGEEVDSCQVDLSAAVAETCDGLDEDCDGLTDEGEDLALLIVDCYEGPPETADVGMCQSGTQVCEDASLGACMDQVLPTDEVCNGEDDDCDGVPDDGFDDQDSDGVADCVDDDVDGDGVSNDADNCVETPNPEQIDADGDGVGDVCDSWGCGTVFPEGAILVTTPLDGFEDDGQCSLREAIEASNTDQAVGGCIAGAGDDMILFQPFDTDVSLSLMGAYEDDNASGDLDIHSGLTIVGCEAGETVLHGGAMDRVLHVHNGASVKLVGLTVAGGRSAGHDGQIPTGGYMPGSGWGGGIYNAGELVLEGVTMVNNEAVGGSGSDGAHAPGDGGGGGGGAGLGGAIYSAPSAQTIIVAGANGCAFRENTALGGGGGRGRHHGSVSPFTGYGGGGGGSAGGNGGNATSGGAGGFGGGGGGGGGASGGSAGGAGGFGGGGGGGGGSVWGGNSGNGGPGGFGGGQGGQGCCSGAGGGAGGAGLGGAIFNDGGFVSVKGCLIEGNQALGGAKGSGFYSGPGTDGGGYGGAIFDHTGDLVMEELDLIDNAADTEGDSVYTTTP